MTNHTASSTPAASILGRGVVICDGAAPPEPWGQAPKVRIDAAVLDDPAHTVGTLHHHWLHREPVVIELDVDPTVLKEPEWTDEAPHIVGPDHAFHREQLQFLVWANNYDLRTSQAIWWHGVLAERHAGASPVTASPVTGDVVLPDGRPAWIDGGPRGPISGWRAAVETGEPSPVIVHRESVALRQLTITPATPVAADDDLADDQRAAVEHPFGPARIIAPAGSGKTRVLTSRLRHLVVDRGVEPALITAVAYNTRAANEMRTRLADINPSVRTLHSLALWICGLNERRQVIHERDVRDLLRHLVSVPRIPNQDPYQPYLDALADVRIGLMDPEEVELQRGDIDGFAEMFPRFREELARKAALDFDEQIYRALELLLTQPSIRQRVQRACTHLLVDEFQDLTPAFLLLVRLVAGPSMQVFAVGDDDQTIYGYTGATPQYLVDIDRWFPGTRAHALEINYRCPQAVVTGATNLLSHNVVRVDKTIRARDQAPAGNLEVHHTDAAEMADRALALIADSVHPPDHTAALVRVNSALLGLQVTLTEAGIGHTAPLDTSVLNRTGLRTAFAYLRIGLDADHVRRDDLLDTINRPARKVKSAVAPLLKGQRFTRAQLRRVGDALDPTHRDRFADYLADLNRLSRAITDGATSADCLALIRYEIGLGEAMDALDASRSRPEGSSHSDDLDALEQVARRHPDPAGLQAWLTATLNVAADPSGVTLSTVHRVKGMEWDHIIVFAANAGLFPHRLAEDDEEERRVFHVAITRGGAQVDVVADRHRPSPFVAELHQAADPADIAKRRQQLADRATARTRRGTTGANASGGSTGNAAANITELDIHVDTNDALFVALRDWRAHVARTTGVPAYLVFHDRHLHMIAGRRPANLRELAACPGVGPTKLERYGDDLLDLIDEHT
ncbi:MAG: ATP-dependent DNA helicase UvrD2 [Nitriliruptoraceae bacterium]